MGYNARCCLHSSFQYAYTYKFLFQNCGILLTKLKMTDEEITAAILSVDENDELSKDMVEQVFRNCVEIFRSKISYHFLRRILDQDHNTVKTCRASLDHNSADLESNAVLLFILFSPILRGTGMTHWRERSPPTDVAWVRFQPRAICGLSLLLVFALL